MVMYNTKYMKIRIEKPRKNQVKGFYLLITNGPTYCNKKNEFIIDRELMEVLKKEKIKYKEIPLKIEDLHLALMLRRL